ncbi:MAG TPA: FAD/NAD(P)-binding oxidoreductase, partial [Spirochaetales bacterium]|nr:FAD/NAD(P)-binding oxidoreductase [Spirochaetales bacterium]
MKELQYEGVVIGGGAAGMAAALELIKNGVSCAIIEREPHLGGILTQCIHNGFGLIEFNEELSGPEFAEKFEDQVKAQNITYFLSTTVMEIQNAEGKKILYCYSSEWGILKITCDVLILAMGCRERNRGNIRIPGDRPAGVYTAGLAQRLVNIEGYIPGKDIVIIGSGDIGLIMARRMSWVGCKVHA